MRRVLPLVLLLVACRPPGYGKDPGDVDAGAESPDARDDQPAPDAEPGAPDAGPVTPDATPVSCDATFRLEGYGTATAVSLTGSFVDWAGTPAAGAVPLTLGTDGVWTVTRTFTGGSYTYKFIVDGTWMPDPGNPMTADDGFGGVNSVYVCP